MTDGIDQNTNPDGSGSTAPTGEQALPTTYTPGAPVDPVKFQEILDDRARKNKLLQDKDAELLAANARLAEIDEAKRLADEADMSAQEKLQSELQAERDKTAALTAKGLQLEYANAAIGAQANDANYVTWLMSEAAKTNTDKTSTELLEMVKTSHPASFGAAAAAPAPVIGAAAGGQGSPTTTETDPLIRAEKEREDLHKEFTEMKVKGARQDDLAKVRQKITNLTFKISELKAGIKRE